MDLQFGAMFVLAIALLLMGVERFGAQIPGQLTGLLLLLAGILLLVPSFVR